MVADVERPLFRVQTGNDLKARLVDGTFRVLGVLQSNANLITQLCMFVCLEILYRLSKVVLDEVEEGAVVLLHPRVAYDECAVRDDRNGRLIERGLIMLQGALWCRVGLVALRESTGTASMENIDVGYRERCGRVGHSFGSIQETSESGKRVVPDSVLLTHDQSILLDHYRHRPDTMIRVRRLPFAIRCRTNLVTDMEHEEDRGGGR